ncbi:RNA polymerase sigma factor [Nocardioides euryhalodurans]|uniref:RNA polymerase subunit sigma-70 n=1 Tax=Nocardioides euryhalodurans TaxID=2518370 RepID=A0A4P7GLC4_9ACTN|nr:DUF6596 domain-containing protein [Nocardioides euryhalodurans]QBR92733.1 RNA polymerase subunit sigma-70 [Nocardioides euryhalodurans]
MTSPTAAAVDEVARTSYGRLVAYLATVSGDLAAAEDALGDALVAALSTWPDRGIPERPESWLLTAARRRIIDASRRRDVARSALPELARAIEERWEQQPAGEIPDDRLRLMFACAHPAIAPEMRSPLILQAVLGLDAARISRAFLVAPTTMGQRLVRAKAKIKDAGIPFRVPGPEELPERLDAVLEAVYAAYGTGWDDVDGLDDARQELVPEAIRLARLLTELLPGEPETHGLLSLMLHSHARHDARRDASGAYVPLADQDVTSWSRELVGEAERHLAVALGGGRLGPYQLLAAIQSLHNRRSATGQTHWNGIVQLYDGLIRLAPTTGTAVARAAAHRQVSGASTALAQLDALVAELGEAAVAGYQPYWVLRALCEQELGLPTAPASADRAVALTTSPHVTAHLRRTLRPGSA